MEIAKLKKKIHGHLHFFNSKETDHETKKLLQPTTDVSFERNKGNNNVKFLSKYRFQDIYSYIVQHLGSTYPVQYFALGVL